MKRISILVAIAMIFAWVPARADESDDKIAQGMAAYKKNDNDAALSAFQAAIELNEKNPQAWLWYGKAQRSSDPMPYGEHTGKAMKSYEKAIELKPDYAEAHFERGNILVGWSRMGLMKKEQRAKAIEAFSDAIKYDPNKAEYYIRRGEEYDLAYEDGLRDSNDDWPENKDKAKADYVKAVELDPANIDAHIGRAKFIGDEEEAIKDLNFVLEKKPGDWDALALRYVIYKDNSEWEKEVEDLKPLVKKSLAEDDYFIDLAEAYTHLDQHADALDVLDIFQARLEKNMKIPKGMEPKNDLDREFFENMFAKTARLIARNQARRGNALAGKKEFDAALAAFDKSLESDKTNAEVYAYRAEVLHDQGKDKEAVAELRKGMADPGVYSRSLFESRHNMIIAEHFIAEKDLEKAAAAARKAAELEKDYDRAIALDAKMRAANKDVDGAIEQYERLIRLKPRNIDAYVGLAKAQQGKKDVDAAIASFEKALSLDPNKTEARLAVGFLYGVKGDKEKSREALEQAAANASPEDAKRGAKIVESMLKGNPDSQLLKDTLAKLQEKAAQ